MSPSSARQPMSCRVIPSSVYRISRLISLPTQVESSCVYLEKFPGTQYINALMCCLKYHVHADAENKQTRGSFLGVAEFTRTKTKRIKGKISFFSLVSLSFCFQPNTSDAEGKFPPQTPQNFISKKRVNRSNNPIILISCRVIK